MAGWRGVAKTSWWAIAVALGVLASGCSDDTGSGSGADAGAGGQVSNCQGAFCTDNDVRIAVSPSKLLFADLAPGQSQELTLVVSHIGSNATLVVSAATLQPASDEFAVVDFQPLSLAKGQKAPLKVRYTPKAAGKKQLALVLANNDRDAAKQKLAVPIEVAQGNALLLVTPNPVDFGNVAGGAESTLDVTLTNTGTVPLVPTAIALSKSESPDFGIVSAPPLGQPIAAGGNATLVLRYTPKGGDNDKSLLQIETGNQKKVSVEVRGNEIAPRIAVVPPVIKLGAMELGTAVTVEAKLCNTGLAPLEVSKVELSAVSVLKDVQVALQTPLTVEPPLQPGTCQSGVAFQVTAKTDKPLPKTGSAVASLVLSSNDPTNPNLVLPLYAETNAPKLEVTPGDYVDFSLVGKGVTVTRKVELFNAGSAPLDITKVYIDSEKDGLGEFSVVKGAFAPTAVNPAPATLAEGGYDFFQVQFVAKGPSNQKAEAKLHILSTDPALPEVVLPMYAERKDSTVCQVTLLPPVLNFGLLPYGQGKTLPLGFKNTGSGVCKFKQVQLTDCKGNGLPPPLGPGPIKCTSSGTTKFAAGAPSTSLFKLGPGETGKMQVTFTAPEDLGFLLGKPNEVTPFEGLLVATFEDDASGALLNFPNVKLLDPAAVSAAKPNLQAKVGKAQVTVLPGQVDFGVVTVGCKSPAKEVSVFNTGTTDAYVNKLELAGCGVEVQGVGWPAIPKTGLPISQVKPATFKVQYGPQNTGKDQCQLLVYTSLSGVCQKPDGTQTGVDCSVNGDCGAGEFCAGQLFTVPLTGEGTLDTEFTDEFVQGTGKQVDVLFVVDNSGSMGEEQSNLAKNFSKFVQIASVFQNSYHIGLVTTDMEAADHSGKLRPYKDVRVVTPATAAGPSALLNMANQGTQGSSSEQGLAAAEAALTLPNVYDSGKSCSADADCKNDGGFCIPDADTPATKKCGGTNRTFLRKNAGLEVVILSDEEDQSAADINYYTNFFYSIKGFANKGLFHLHAIVGDPGQGCQSSNGEAEAGERYLQVAKNTGGQIGSICDNDFAQILQDIGQVAFGLAQQFFLTRTPEPATITVKINGQECPKGQWQYDEPSNSVVFPQNSTCVPQKGDKVTIWYKMLCFP